MAAEPRVMMRDYCKRSDTEQISLGFQPADLVNLTSRCLPSETIQTWKEQKDKFLERFFTHNQFQKRKAYIMNFKQHDNETLGEAYERFNLLKRKCTNHSLDLMELMHIFTG
ncbi:hypothetical protein L195_g033172 [Trifolium pratense]|uniref:Retrotransposon gag domain-containing protein n=1 Tax=Trifolium pratense TaxID=57577 RepID=A0A2K3LF78_TRIPR|nr:hypothetical protein L195_g033172 [Trifolium pratense]